MHKSCRFCLYEWTGSRLGLLQQLRYRCKWATVYSARLLTSLQLVVNSIVLFWVTDPISEKPQDVGTGITDNFPHFAPFDEAESTVALPAATINKTCYDGWRPTGQQTLHELQVCTVIFSPNLLTPRLDPCFQAGQIHSRRG